MTNRTFGSGRFPSMSALLCGTALCCAAGAARAQGAQTVENASAATCTNPSPNHAALSGMVIGFSQSENEQNPFRAGETNSVKQAAAKAGAKLLYTNANDNQAKQVADIESMIAQGAQALVVAPLNATGLQPALDQAEAKHIPVVTIDRVTAGEACREIISNMGSDFFRQGQRAAAVLAQVTGGHAKIIEIQGAYGNNVETERTDGFKQGLAGHPGMTILAAQTGNWSTTDAQRVTEQLLLAHHNLNAVYAQADVMALGAMTALRQGGKTPGHDVKIVSIDGTRALVQQVADGNANAIVETNPRFGPQALDALTKWFAGSPVPQKIIMKDALYTNADAAAAIANGAPY